MLLIARSMVPVINALPHLAAWRTLTFASCSFPQSLGRFGPDSESPIIRTEWQIWMQLISLGPRLLRVPSFGDYAVNYPEETFVDPRIMRMSANLVYAR